MAQSIQKIEQILIEKILPAWNNQYLIEPAPFMEMVKKVTLKEEIARGGAEIGINGGFGYGAETGNTPNANEQMYEDFKIRTVNMYHELAFTDKATYLADNAGSNAIFATVQNELRTSYKACKWHVGRSLFMDSRGILANIEAEAVATNVLKVDNTKYIKEGVAIDIYEKGDAVGSTPAVANRRVLAVNRVTGTITISGTASTFDEGFITVQNSYGLELFGLGALFDTTNFTSIYGVERSATKNTYLNPVIIDASGALDNNKINNAIRNTYRIHGTDIDLVMFGDTAFDVFTEYLRIQNVTFAKDFVFKGGARGYEILYGNRVVKVVNEEFIPDDEIWGVDTSTFEFHSTGWNLMRKGAESGFNRIAGKAIYTGLLTNYGNLISSNPGGIFKMTNVTGI